MQHSISYIDQIFEKVPFPEKGMGETRFEHCHFSNCDFTEAHLSNCHFESCYFKECNLSLIKVQSSVFDQVFFEHCKMVGIDFSKASDFLFQIKATSSTLDYTAFTNKSNKNVVLTGCSFKGADFTGADFSGSKFIDCNLEMALFERTSLQKADFTSSYNFHIKPEINQLKGAKFSPQGLVGLLEHHGIIVK